MSGLERDMEMWRKGNNNINVIAMLACCIEDYITEGGWIFIPSEFMVSELDLAISEYNNKIMHDLYENLPIVVLLKRYGIEVEK